MYQDKFEMPVGRVIRESGIAIAAAASVATSMIVTAPAAAQAEAPANCSGRTESGVWLNVVAEGMRSSDGQLAITVYADKRKDFLAKGGAIWVGFFPAKQGNSRGCVFLPDTGVYAIALYHDENSNQNFDRNFLPTEGYGFSNNPSTLAGLPSWKSVRLNVSKTNLTTRISMKYP